MLKGMIFDFDGTLFDSMFIWDTAGERYLRSIGKDPRQDLREILKPMSLQQSAEYLKEQYLIPAPVEKIMDGIDHIVEDFYFRSVMPKAGVLQWLEALYARNIKMCIATATARYQVEAALMRCGMRRFFTEIFPCTELGSGKDQPMIFRAALEHLGTDRSNTAVVEDAFHAIHTAKQDGFRIVAVCDAHEHRQGLIRSMADVYLTDYHDLSSFWKFASAE